MNIGGYQNYRSSLLMGFRAEKNHIFRFCTFWGSLSKEFFLHILILNILFFNKLRQIIPEIRSERRDLLIFIFILKTTGTFTPVHSTGYLILRNEFKSTQEVARQNIQVSFYIRSINPHVGTKKTFDT
jgi:hypothetical protein